MLPKATVVESALGTSNLIPFRDEFTNDNFDVRHRVTLNGLYELPFGKGRKYMHQGGILDYLVGGWSDSATWERKRAFRLRFRWRRQLVIGSERQPIQCAYDSRSVQGRWHSRPGKHRYVWSDMPLDRA